SADGVRGIMENEGRASRQATSETAALNKSTFERLTQAISAPAAESLRAVYNHRAYPNIYQDARSAEPHLSAALKLEDLSPAAVADRGLADVVPRHVRPILRPVAQVAGRSAGFHQSPGPARLAEFPGPAAVVGENHLRPRRSQRQDHGQAA